MNNRTFYITTPIYYPNDKLHIGHSYTTVAADALARYKRLQGYDVMYLTGTDEHGQKIQQRAEQAGKTPKEFLDEIIDWIKDLWNRLDISYDDFIRTTQERHTKVVEAIFERFIDQGDIYLSDYEGWYCTPCESFWSERELVDGNCPDCGRPVQYLKEKSYFFRMSKYVDRLLAYYDEHPEFIAPPSRKHEMVNNFLKPGLQDLCVSRTSFDWGIHVKRDPEHVVYVWLDALTNYITAIGYGSDDPSLEEKFKKYWPADVHFVGKDIVRFHVIYWPIFLLALGLPLPKRVYGHGFFMMKDGKMSKSKGNVIDPKLLIHRYGSDAIRYFLLREVPFGQDGVFTPESLVERLNFDLANDLGNLVHRTAAMLGKFCNGVIPRASATQEPDQRISDLSRDVARDFESHMDAMEFSVALGDVWRLVRAANKYIDDMAPWTLAKQDGERLGTVMYTTAEVIRILAVLLQPFVPRAAASIILQFGLESVETAWSTVHEFGTLQSGHPVAPGEPLFPRLDVKEEIAALEGLTGRPKDQGETAPATNVPRAKEDANPQTSDVEQIGIEDFSRVALRVGQILQAERIKGADKLLKLQVDLGVEQRQIVSGIALYYEPESLIGHKVVVVTNLKPVKLRGVESQGMLLCAEEGNTLKLVSVPADMANGAVVK